MRFPFGSISLPPEEIPLTLLAGRTTGKANSFSFLSSDNILHSFFFFFGKRILLCGLGRSLHSTNRKAFFHILVNLTIYLWFYLHGCSITLSKKPSFHLYFGAIIQ